jgi:hypothetical protein
MTEEDKFNASMQLGQLWSAIRALESIKWDYGVVDFKTPKTDTQAALFHLRNAYNELVDKYWERVQS